MRLRHRGFSLIEVVIALSVLLVGVLGLMRLQILGLTWNQSSRSHTRAMELALELRAGLESLPYGDPRLAVTGTWGTTAPTPFGALLKTDGTATSGATPWNDASPIPGVSLDSTLGPDPYDSTRPAYARRWTVWGYTSMSSMNAGALIIAVSVIYVDRGSRQAREVVIYTVRSNPAAVLSNIRISS
jgi:prepilin-type N-terminal cleavage/methylation domain-containing protein